MCCCVPASVWSLLQQPRKLARPLPLLSPFTRAHQALCVTHLSPEVAWSPTQNFASELCLWPLLAITWVSQVQRLGLSEPPFLNLIAQIPMLVHRVTVVAI